MRDLPKQDQTEQTLKAVLGELGDFKAALDKHRFQGMLDEGATFYFSIPRTA